MSHESSTHPDLSAYLDGELTDAEAAELEAELARDPELRADLSELEQVVDWMRRDGPDQAPLGFHRRVMDRVEREYPRQPSFWAWLRRPLGIPLEGWLVAAAAAAVLFSVLPGSNPDSSVGTEVTSDWPTPSEQGQSDEEGTPAVAAPVHQEQKTSSPNEDLSTVAKGESTEREAQTVDLSSKNAAPKVWDPKAPKDRAEDSESEQLKLAVEDPKNARLKELAEAPLQTLGTAQEPALASEGILDAGNTAVPDFTQGLPSNGAGTDDAGDLATPGYRYTITSEDPDMKLAVLRLSAQYGQARDVNGQVIKDAEMMSNEEVLVVQVPQSELYAFGRSLQDLGYTLERGGDATLLPGRLMPVQIRLRLVGGATNTQAAEPAAVKRRAQDYAEEAYESTDEN